jgi:hypothetical protein
MLQLPQKPSSVRRSTQLIVPPVLMGHSENPIWQLQSEPVELQFVAQIRPAFGPQFPTMSSPGVQPAVHVIGVHPPYMPVLVSHVRVCVTHSLFGQSCEAEPEHVCPGQAVSQRHALEQVCMPPEPQVCVAPGVH